MLRWRNSLHPFHELYHGCIIPMYFVLPLQTLQPPFFVPYRSLLRLQLSPEHLLRSLLVHPPRLSFFFHGSFSRFLCFLRLIPVAFDSFGPRPPVVIRRVGIRIRGKGYTSFGFGRWVGVSDDGWETSTRVKMYLGDRLLLAPINVPRADKARVVLKIRVGCCECCLILTTTETVVRSH